MVRELQKKLDNDYPKITPSQNLIPLPPAHIEAKAIDLVKKNSYKHDNFQSMKDRIKSFIGTWNDFFSYAENELEKIYPKESFIDWERAMVKANKEPGWSVLQKCIFACKETLTPLFVDEASPLICKGISLLGKHFESFAQTTFMAEVIQYLLTFIIEQVYAATGGPGAEESGKWRVVLIDLCLFILKWILLLLFQSILQEYLPGYPLIDWLLRTISFFIEYMINRIRDYTKK